MRHESISPIMACLFLGSLIFIDQSALCITRMTPDVSQTMPILAGKMIRSDRSSTDNMKNIVSSDSGLEGTTHFKVISGVPGGRTTSQPASIEFAVAPIENDAPSYNQSMFVKSDELGKFKIPLPPGKYWLGPKGKALDPINYAPASISVSEETIVVKQGTFTKIDVFQVGYAP